MVKEIPVTKGDIAIVDDDDYEYLAQFKWYLHDAGYAVANIKGTKKYMHRLILSAKKGDVVDHVNHNPLDNRKENIRICTQRENMRNSRNYGGRSKYRGVTEYKRSKYKWAAKIVVEEGTINIGYYHTEIEAAYAYDLAAKEYYGEFALLNNVKVKNFIPYKSTRNKSGVVGVLQVKKTGRWRASIYHNRKIIDLGTYVNKQDAVDARKKAEEMKASGQL